MLLNYLKLDNKYVRILRKNWNSKIIRPVVPAVKL